MFGERLKKLRLDKGLTLRELANELGMSYSAIGNYERGVRQCGLDTLMQFASFFNVTTNYLLGVDEIKNYQDYLILKDIDSAENLDIESIASKLEKADPKFKKEITDMLDSFYRLVSDLLDSDSIKLAELNSELFNNILLMHRNLYKIENLGFSHLEKNIMYSILQDHNRDKEKIYANLNSFFPLYTLHKTLKYKRNLKNGMSSSTLHENND